MFRGALALASARLAQSACDGCSFDVTALEEFSIDFELKVAVFPEFFNTAGPVFTTAHLPDNLPSEYGSLALHARNLQLKLDNQLSFPTQMPHVPHNEEMDQDVQQLSGMQIHEELHINGAAGVASLHVDSPIMNLCFQLDHLPTVIAQQLQQEQRHDVISQQLQQAEQVVPALLQQHGVRATVDGEDVVGWKTGMEVSVVPSTPPTQVGFGQTACEDGEDVYTQQNGCNGWARTSQADCIAFCEQNAVPSGCARHDDTICRYAMWDRNPDWYPGWCQLASTSCVLQDGHGPTSVWEISASSTQESAGSWPGANAILFDNSTSHPALVLLGAATPHRPDDVSLALKFSNYNNSVGNQFAVRACEIETQIATQSFLATNPETRTFIASRIATHQNRLKALLQPQTLNSRFNFIPLEIAGLMVTAESSCATELAQIPQSGSFTFQIAVCAAFSFVVGIGTTRFLGKKSVTPADEYLLNAA